MAEKKQLGLYWGPNSFTLVELLRSQIGRRVHVPFGSPLKTEQNQDLPEGLRLTALLQQVVRDSALSANRIFLSISSRNLIFRSFVIPFMQEEEIRRVLEFEAPKYIPLKMEHLVYTYHAVPVTEDKQKKLRIIFVAIRRDILNRDLQILENSGLQIVYIEPSAISLTRVLIKHDILPREGCQAVIIMGATGEEVIFVEDGVVQFVRELKTALATGQTKPAASKLFNDIRVSFNYYARHNPSRQIDKVILLSSQDPSKLAQDMAKEFSVPVHPLTAAGLLNDSQGMDVEILHAYGASLKDKTITSKDFSLLDRVVVKSEGALAFEKLNWMIIGGGLALAALIIAAAYMGSNTIVAGAKKQIALLEQKQGLYSSFEAEQLETKISEVKTSILSYGGIRSKSHMAVLLAKIPTLLPEGAWLKTMDLESYSTTLDENGVKKEVSRISLSFDALVFTDDSNEQFRLVNNLLADMREENKQSKMFQSIDLISTKQSEMDRFPVTSFRIVCK